MKFAAIITGKYRNLVANQKGVAAIEFAIIVPVILLMLVALWNISFYETERLRLERVNRSLISNIVKNFSMEPENNQIYEAEKNRILSEQYDSGDLLPTFNENYCLANFSGCEASDCIDCDYIVVTLTGSKKIQTPMMGDSEDRKSVV